MSERERLARIVDSWIDDERHWRGKDGPLRLKIDDLIAIAALLRAGAPPADVAGLVEKWQKRAAYFRSGYLIVPPVSRDEYSLGGATRHRPAKFDEWAEDALEAADALAALARERDVLKSIVDVARDTRGVQYVGKSVFEVPVNQFNRLKDAIAEHDRARAALGGNDAA